MDKFAALTAFSAVVEAGGFAAAARDLGLSRSQVNRLVIGLEEALGVQLLHRTTRRVAPTAAGEAFHGRARAILAELAAAEGAVQDTDAEPAGELRVNGPMSFGTLHLAPALADFMAAHPRVRVQLQLDDRFVDPVAEGFDLTVRIAGPSEQPSLVDHELVEARRVVCASPGFLARHGAPEAPEDLVRMPCLHYGHLASGSRWRLSGPDGTRDVRVDGVLCSNNAEVLRDAALRDLGIALLPTFIAGPELRSGRLVPILPEHHAPPIQVCLLYPAGRHASGRLRALVRFLYERFEGRPYWDRVE